MGDVVEEGEVSFLHPHSTRVGFLSLVLPQQDNLGFFSGKSALVQ